jgi:hypothetical protein
MFISVELCAANELKIYSQHLSDVIALLCHYSVTVRHS